MVERFFRDITDKRIRRGVFTSVPDLEAAINEYIAVHNAHAQMHLHLDQELRARMHIATPSSSTSLPKQNGFCQSVMSRQKA